MQPRPSPTTYTLSYDAENRLVEVKKNNVTLMNLDYDGDGQRVKSTLAGTPNSTVTRFVGSLYEYETVGSTTNTRQYYYAGSLRVAMREGAGTGNTGLKYLMGDHLGSTSLTKDATTGTTITQLYRAWGEVRWSSGTLPTKYTYTGQYSNISEFGWMYYNARWFDPALSRFGQADSIVPGAGNPMAWDRYAYSFNSPIQFSDPTGHCPVSYTGKPSENGCWKYWKRLSEKYPNVYVDPLTFSISQLKIIGRALHIARTAFGGQANFAKAVGAFSITTANSPLHTLETPGLAPPGLSYIFLVSDYFSDVPYQINTILHEIGHVFDFHGAGADPMKYKSQAFVDKFAPGCDVGYFGCLNANSRYAPYNIDGASGGYNVNTQRTTDYGWNSSIDDFAETFAAYAWLSVDMTPYKPVHIARLRLMRKIIQAAIQ